jgi:hypothetical protein
MSFSFRLILSPLPGRNKFKMFENYIRIKADLDKLFDQTSTHSLMDSSFKILPSI